MSGQSGDSRRARFMERMRSKYRLVISNAETYQEIWGMRLSRMNFLVILGVFFIFVLLLSWLIISFTPIREFIPGYTSSAITQQVVDNAIKADSLHRKVDLWSSYLDNLRVILSGGTPDSYLTASDSVVSKEEVLFTRSAEDSLLRLQVEQDLQLSSSAAFEGSSEPLKRYNFMPPVMGEIISGFDPSRQHFGTDIVSAPDSPISSVGDGTVVLCTWDKSFGHVIVVQHTNGMLSIYKHNRRLLKRENDQVKRGDAIAIMGNTGELTTGPHLHFELWHQGRALNPENYIVF